MGKSDYRINVRLKPSEYNKFIKFKEQGLSAREVLAQSCTPCCKCAGIDVVTYNKETGKEIKIPKGIISKRNN